MLLQLVQQPLPLLLEPQLEPQEPQLLVLELQPLQLGAEAR